MKDFSNVQPAETITSNSSIQVTPRTCVSNENFHQSFDAREWAKAFRETAVSLGYSDMDEGWLYGWFANAIMHGFNSRPHDLPLAPEPGLR